MSAAVLRDIQKFVASTKGARNKVAAFVLEHAEDVAFMTIEALAESVQVSTSTISRVTREMGFQGFADLQEQVRQLVRRNVTPAGKLREAGQDASDCAASIAWDIKNLQSILQRNEAWVFERAAELLATAPGVHVMGMRSSYPLAFFLSMCLRQLRDNVYSVDPGADLLAESVMRLRPGDLAVLIAFPRYSRKTVLLAEEAKHCGCSLLAITDSIASPLALRADVTLLAPYESLSFFNSNVAGVSIINILLARTGGVLQQAGAEHLLRHDAILTRWGALVGTQEAWSLGKGLFGEGE